jgi:hypothetical protein
MRSRIDDLHDELQRLMLEHVESIKEETFLGVVSEEEFHRHEMRLKRIRELSADYLATLERNLRASKTPMKEGDSMPEKPEKPSVTLPGKVEKIIPSPNPTEPEKAEIAIDGPDPLYREIRIENSLTDEDGGEVHLKKEADVDVTVEADKDATTSKGANSKKSGC